VSASSLIAAAGLPLAAYSPPSVSPSLLISSSFKNLSSFLPRGFSIPWRAYRTEGCARGQRSSRSGKRSSQAFATFVSVEPVR